VEEEKPYWMDLTGGTSFSGPLRFELENYFPEAHYKQAVDKAFQKAVDKELVSDGGQRVKYYWSGEDGIMYHTEVENEFVDPFFNTIDEAERFLQNQADIYGEERYQGMVLRRTGNRKMKEATDVLTEQSGLSDW
jgi:hypothetical protein